ncbi:MAG: threonine-phosphate decarboxylase CobD [Pseudomonadota bacterium]|nr:threonine-phosphate decarboxylase CobD [Pseudomonadota bacterium]
MKLAATAPALAAHGGNLQQAIDAYGGDASEWLDLSTGISPFSWYEENPLTLPVAAVHALPAADEQLAAAVRGYYGREALTVAGSQAAIRQLPLCFGHGLVWVLKGTYGEHRLSWQNAGHEVHEQSAATIRTALDNDGPLPDMLVLVNPGNPGGERFTAAELLRWADRLHSRQGWLLVDETFADCDDRHSLLRQRPADNLLVLRSPGKFFGLAGLRIGFVFAAAPLRQRLAQICGPWAVSGPAQVIAARALADHDWQQQQRMRLQRAGERLQSLCRGLPLAGKTELFITLQSPQAADWQRQLAQQKIWTRLFAQQLRLRIGLPASEQGWLRLQQALISLTPDQECM